MNKERWTSNSPLSAEVPLIVEYDPTQYGFPPDEIPTPKLKQKKNAQISTSITKKRKATPPDQTSTTVTKKRKATPADQTSTTITKKRKWKKRMLGVNY
tara:strand:- start:93 stop:389 length:297 start_codon:yes stop_codon:yes gene_type:complete